MINEILGLLFATRLQVTSGYSDSGRVEGTGWGLEVGRPVLRFINSEIIS